MAFRSGFVSILGRPNAGKSTLLNRIVGMKVAIVSDKPQTTRQTLQGVANRKVGDDDAQIIFLDTPGIHKGGSKMNRVRGVALLAVAEAGLKLAEYSPLEVK